MKTTKSKKSFDWYGTSQRFSIRKYHFGAASALLGTALLLGQSPEAKAEITHNQDKTITYTDDKTKQTVTVDAGFLAQNSTITVDAPQNPGYGAFADIPKAANDSTGAAEGTDTLTGNVKGSVEYKEVGTNAELKTKLENQDLGDVTLATPYDKEKLVAEKDGKNYRETAATVTTDLTVGKEESLTSNNKEYAFVRSELVGDAKKSVDVAETTFNDVTAKVTPEGLHTATGDINYTALPTGGKVYIVEELSDGVYGKYVEAASVASDEAVVTAFKAGRDTAKDFTSANVGALSANDIIVVLDKDTYSVSNYDALSFESQTFEFYNAKKVVSQPLDFAPEGGVFTADDVIFWLDSWLANNHPELTALPKIGTFKTHAPITNPDDLSVDYNNDIIFNATPSKAVLDAANAEFQAEKEKIYAEIRALNNWTLGADGPRDDRKIYGAKLYEAYAKIQNRIYDEFLTEVDKLDNPLSATTTISPVTNVNNALFDVTYSEQTGEYTDILRGTQVVEDLVGQVHKEIRTVTPDLIVSTNDRIHELITPVRAFRVAAPEALTLVHYYEEVKKGSVLVKYVEAGTTNELVPAVPAVTDRPLKDGPYDASGFKQDTVQDKEGKIWELVGLEANSKPEKGDLVADQTLEVVYGYKLKTEETAEGALVNSKVGTVLVDFVDETGQAIPGIDQVTLKDKVTVETSQKFVTKSGTVVISERTEVTPVQDAYDAKPLATPTITAKDGKVYEFVKLLSGTEAGDVQEGTHNVVYQYRLKTEESQAGDAVASKKGSVEVQYVNEAGETIKAPEADTTDATVETTTTFVTKSGTVEISRRDQVTPLVVNYDTTDKKENEITAADGTIYEYSKVRSGAETGQVVEGKTVVVYEYRVKPIFVIPNLPVETVDIPAIEINAEEKDGDLKDSKVGKVTVEHILEDGTLITSEVDTPDTVVERTQTYVTKTKDGLVLNSRDEVTPVEVNYDTTDLKAEYKEFNGKKYYFLKVADNSAAETGKVAAGETKVVYVYRLVEGETPDLPVLTIDIPELNIGVPNLPGELPPTTPEKPELNIGVPNLPGELPPTNPEKPELNIGVPNLPGELPPTTPEKPELNIGVPNLPGEFPPTTPEKPELNIGVPNLPGEFPPTTPEKPELNIGVPNLPGEFPPTVPEKPELELPSEPETFVPGDFPVVDKPELDLEVPNGSGDLPPADGGDKPSNDKPSPKGSKPAPKAPQAKAGALPKTSATGSETNSAMPAGLAAALLAAGLLARRRKEDK